MGTHDNAKMGLLCSAEDTTPGKPTDEKLASYNPSNNKVEALPKTAPDGGIKSVYNPVSADDEKDDVYVALKKFDRATLVDYAFDQIDCSGGGSIGRKELKNSSFKAILMPVWNNIDTDGDLSLSRDEWKGWFASLDEKLGSKAAADKFVYDMMWNADSVPDQ